MDFELIINPTKEEDPSNRYRAVLLYKGGLNKGYPHDMSLDDVLASVATQVHGYADGNIKLTYNIKG